MKEYTLLAALIFTVLFPASSRGQSREIYTNPNFYTLTKNEKELAILPFKVTLNLRPKDRANLTDEALKAKETDEGRSAQSAMETFLLDKSTRKNYTVTFQDVSKTNALLKANGITPDSIALIEPARLCQLLGVDGIISGNLTSSHPLSTGAAVAVDVLVGFGGKTNSGECIIAINDGATGKLLWRYHKSLSRGLGSDVNTIIDTIMKKASKKFPYNM